MSLIDEIRGKFKVGKYEFSRHAVDQSLHRNITVNELLQTVASGEVIEDYPNDKYGPSCLILGFTTAQRAIHVQCSYPSRPVIKVVTIYEPDPTMWRNNRKRQDMSQTYPSETFVEKLVTYTIDLNGQVVVVEHVPARVCEQTGEQFFSPETVRRIHEIVRGNQKPARMIQTPVYEFAA